jgi:hypothetical protein
VDAGDAVTATDALLIINLPNALQQHHFLLHHSLKSVAKYGGGDSWGDLEAECISGGQLHARRHLP